MKKVIILKIRESIEKIIKNPWFKISVGIIGTIGSFVTFIIYQKEIFFALRSMPFRTVNLLMLQIPIWSLLLLIFLIALAMKVSRAKKRKEPDWLKYKMDMFNTSLLKSTISFPVSFQPLEMKEYQINLGDNVLFVWDYIEISENEYKIDEEKFKPICDKCMCDFIYSESFRRLYCPVCKRKIYLGDEQKNKVKALIERKIKTGEFRKSKYFSGSKKKRNND